jgi:hypothetical protein
MDYEEARKESWYDQMKSTMIGGHDVRANGGYELLERSTNVVMARAAFEKAVELYPNDRILLQQGARIIAKSTELDPTPGRARQSMVDNYSKTRGRIRPQAKSQNLCDEELSEDSNLGPLIKSHVPRLSDFLNRFGPGEGRSCRTPGIRCFHSQAPQSSQRPESENGCSRAD